ncbi:LGFP repeat-containing protein [Pseudarthrobacter siccitolerans]
MGAATSQKFDDPCSGEAHQLFERGTIAYLPQPGAHIVIGGINSVWLSIGAQNSDLGYPTSDEYMPLAGGVMQFFQFGRISWNPDTGSDVTKGGIGIAWDNAGGPSNGLGYPVTDEYILRPSGAMQDFQYAKIIWNPATGARITKGAIGAAWESVGGPLSHLGYPKTNEYLTARGGVTQDFQFGQIVYSTETGSRFMRGPIGATWNVYGGPRGHLGYLTSNEIVLTGGGAKQYFQYGAVVWSPSIGAKTSTGRIRSA